MLCVVCLSLLSRNLTDIPHWVRDDARAAHLKLQFPVLTVQGVNGIRFFMVVKPGDERGLIDSRIGAFSQNGLKLIESMADLRGLVRVSTPDQALQLARLRTDPASTWTFKKSLGLICFEVMDSSRLPEYFGLGVRPTAIQSGRFRHGYEGGLTHREFTMLGFKPTSVTTADNGFVIHRAVVFLDKDESTRCAEITERVARDGRYEVLGWHPIQLPTADGVTWDLRRPRD